MTTWTPTHSCFTTVSRNNNRALRSKVVVAHIQQVLIDVSYTVIQIQSLIKEKLNVDITYGKAWAARKKAVENIYGGWDENFHELPSYIFALQQAKPGTVVQWLHHPYSPSDCSVFKYVFWAFRPSIEAFSFCIHVISIDATHLRGTYKGKLLMAVSKNANNMILPIAYALVD
ncbi:uncharacterized protein LOC143575648 [Bidens hawaiensis]|uniref:uncharacterized protein LOC143575648 n=1 Tax=Bidens hawaiensis TaxID=980011 RepID=UPI00404B6089